MKQLILFVLLFVFLQQLTAHVIRNNGDEQKRQCIDCEVTRRNPNYRDQSRGFNEGSIDTNIQDLGPARRVQQYGYHRISENERHSLSSEVQDVFGNNVNTDRSRGRLPPSRHSAGRRPPHNQDANNRNIENSGCRDDNLTPSRRPSSSNEGPIRFPASRRLSNRRPAHSNTHSIDVKSEGCNDNTVSSDSLESNTGVKPVTGRPMASEENTTLGDRFITNTGDNCDPGEVRDTITNQCRPEIQD